MTRTTKKYAGDWNAIRKAWSNVLKCREAGALAAFGALTLIAGALAMAADSEVVVPCPSLNTGESWDYQITSPMGSGRVTRQVLSRAGKSILMGTRTLMAISIPGAPSVGSQQVAISEETRLEDAGPLVVALSAMTQGVTIASDPARPYCGKLPARMRIVQKTGTGAFPVNVTSELTARLVGTEKVTVPAGTFEAVVVEFREESAPQSYSAPTMTTTQIYAVPRIGFVRQVSTTMIGGAPVQPRDPRVEALMQQAIAKMQRGEDASAIMKQVADLQGQTNVGTAPPKATANQTILELLSYKIGQ